MKKPTLLVAIAIILVSPFGGDGRVNAQPTIQWQNTIGGGLDDDLQSIQQTSDGGYILGGLSSSDISGDKTENNQGVSDYWVVKLDASGAIQWQNTIGGNDWERLHSIQQTSDGGYVLGGFSASPISGDKTEDTLGSIDYWVVKLDNLGTIQWQNTIGGSGGDDLYSIQQTSDGGYVLGGSSDSPISGDKTENSQGGMDYWVVKLDASGAVQWQNTIGGSSSDKLQSIQQTSDGGYVLGGFSYSDISGDKTESSQGSWDYWVVKLDNLGAIQWQNTIGGSGWDRLYSIQQTSDAGYILGGYSNSPISGDKTENSQGVDDYWVVKLDASGTIQWQNTIGGSSNDWLYSIQQTSDGGYVLGGSSDSPISGDKTEDTLGSFDYWVVKLDVSGVIQWQNTVGGSLSDHLNSIQQTSDGGYVLGGTSVSDISGDKTENSKGDVDYWVVKLCATQVTITGNVTAGVAPVSNGQVTIYYDDLSGAPMAIVATVPLDALGNYTAGPINRVGNFIIKAEADTIAFPDAVPTFYVATHRWDSATAVIAVCGPDTTITANINMIELPALTGTSNLSGVIVTTGKKADPVPGVSISVEQIPGGVIASHTTDSTGTYSFNGVPQGNFTFHISVPGKEMETNYSIGLTTDDSTITGLNFLVGDSTITTTTLSTFIEAANGDMFSTKIYPNPYKQFTTFEYTIEKKNDVTIEVYNMLGDVVFREHIIKRAAGTYSMRFGSTELGEVPGIYTLNLRVGDQMYSTMLVKLR